MAWIAITVVLASSSVAVHAQTQRDEGEGALAADGHVATPYPEERLGTRMGRVASTGRTRGRFTPANAVTLANAIYKHCQDFDPWTVGALAWVESGFRTTAVSPSGRHLGLFQVKAAKRPKNIEFSTKEACGKLRVWRRVCTHGHDFLAHWFAGTRANPKALASAARVRRRARKLRRCSQLRGEKEPIS